MSRTYFPTYSLNRFGVRTFDHPSTLGGPARFPAEIEPHIAMVITPPMIAKSGLGRLGDASACPDISTVAAQYQAPGCSLTYNPALANASGFGPCPVRAWCTTDASAAAQFAIPSPPQYSGWDIHMLSPANSAQAASDAAWQVSQGMQVMPQTAAVLQITGQPIPAPPPPPVSAQASPTPTVSVVPLPIASTVTATPSMTDQVAAWLGGSTSLFNLNIPNAALAAGVILVGAVLLKGKRL